MAVRDDRGDEKQTTAGFRGPLMVQSLTSAKSKFLSLRIRDDIEFTGDIVSAIKIRFPDSDIIIKTHPRTPRALREAFEGNFIDGVCNIDSSSVLPAEAYFVNSHIEAIVAGAYSSSLMYAAEVFNKKAYYCRPPKHLAKYYPKGAVYTIEKTLEKLGVKKITISETLSAA